MAALQRPVERHQPESVGTGGQVVQDQFLGEAPVVAVHGVVLRDEDGNPSVEQVQGDDPAPPHHRLEPGELRLLVDAVVHGAPMVVRVDAGREQRRQ